MTYCQNCVAKMSDKAVFCVKCGVAVAQKTIAASTISDEAALRMIIPGGRLGLPIAAGYLGLFSLFPFVGILVLVTGIFAILDIWKLPERHGLVRTRFGVIL